MPRTLSRAISWTKAHQVHSLDFAQRGFAIWALLGTWDGEKFRRVVIGVLDRFENDITPELSVVGSVFAAVDSSASVVAISGVSHILAVTCVVYLGNGYKKKLVEYLIFDLRLLKRCLQKATSSVFGCLDPFSMTEFSINCLNRAKLRDCMMSRSNLHRAIITNELQIPSRVKVVSNIVGVWQLIVSYLRETGRKTDSDSLMVYQILYLRFFFLFLSFFLF